MLESMRMAWEIIFPVAFMLVIGIGCRKVGLLKDQTVQEVNRLVFNLFLPLMNFINICSTDKTQFFTRDNLVLLAICSVSTVGSAAVMDYVQRLRKCEGPVRGVLVQSAYQTNGAIFALPIITALCGADQLAPMSLLFLVLSPLYMVQAVLVLAPIRSGEMNLKKTLREIARNPIIIASVIAFLLLMLNIKLPVMVMDTLRNMANVTTPLSFVVLGASLSLGGFRKNLPRLCGAGFVRLILVPGLCLCAGLLLGLGGTHIVTMVCLMGAPVAVSSFTLAQTYGADESLAAELVTTTTLAAAVSMFCWITLLNQFALI